MKIQSAFQQKPETLPDLEGNYDHIISLAAPSGKYVIPCSRLSFIAADCSPPTPIDDLDHYSGNINARHNRISDILSGTPRNSLVMGPFAQAVNMLINYVNTLPDQFCIDSSNQRAFDVLNSSLANAEKTIQRGKSFFETNLDQFVGQAFPLVNKLYNASHSIGSASRDFAEVMLCAKDYDKFINGLQLDIWSITPRIDSQWRQFEELYSKSIAEFKRALKQIETNVEADAQKFDDQRKAAEEAFQHWDAKDGKEGYDRFYSIALDVSQVLIPAFNTFLSRVPSTDRINSAASRAQQCVSQIDVGHKSFPTFHSLPSDSSDFPHLRYGAEERKYGGDAIITALRSAALSYNNRTGKKLFIGDMQYEHGGKMGIHRSHKNGLDADVDGVEIGDVPNHDLAKATALAKEILSAGAKIVFYADKTTVDEANNWAAQNGVTGKLQVEANHTKHFHLRMPG